MLGSADNEGSLDGDGGGAAPPPPDGGVTDGTTEGTEVGSGCKIE